MGTLLVQRQHPIFWLDTKIDCIAQVYLELLIYHFSLFETNEHPTYSFFVITRKLGGIELCKSF